MVRHGARRPVLFHAGHAAPVPPLRNVPATPRATPRTTPRATQRNTTGANGVIIHRYLARQILASTLLGTCVVCGPVILVSVVNHLPGNALRTSLVWSAIGGIVPTALSLTLPLAVGVAVTAVFAQLRADATLHVLFTLRFSLLSLCRSAIAVSLVITALVFFLSCVIAPRSVARIHDILHVIRNNLSPALLNPQTFYTVDDGRYTIFFDRRAAEDRVGGVMFQETARDGTRNLIIAREARFVSRGAEQHVLFAGGTLQSIDPAGRVVHAAEFEELGRPFGHDGSALLPQRNWHGMFELDTPDFLARRNQPFETAFQSRAWMAEAVKRFAVPWLALGHSLSGILIVLTWRRGGERRLPSPQLFCLPVVALHLLVLFGAESVHYFGTAVAWLAVATIATECTLPAALLLRMQYRTL